MIGWNTLDVVSSSLILIILSNYGLVFPLLIWLFLFPSCDFVLQLFFDVLMFLYLYSLTEWCYAQHKFFFFFSFLIYLVHSIIALDLALSTPPLTLQIGI